MKYFYAAIRFLGLVLFLAAPASANPVIQVRDLPTQDSQAKDLQAKDLQAKEPAKSTLATSPNFKKDFKVVPQVGARFFSQGGVTDSFFGVEGFVPLMQSPGQNLTYLEGRLQASTNQGRLGSNVLLGHRFLTHSGRSILGGYVSYDTRNTGDGTFQQLGLGVEHLSDAFDFRSNVYLPIGDRSRMLSSTLVGGPRFQGHRLGMDRSTLFQEALTGVDVEVGTKLGNIGRGALRGYVGAYHYSGEGTTPFTGFRTRLVARPTDSLTAGVTLQTDSKYDTRLMFNVGIAFPGNGGGKAAPEPTILARLGESPERQPSILVDQFRKTNFERIVNPVSGRSYYFEFVTLGRNGDGTFESPAGTVAEVLPRAKANNKDFSLVYVQAGTNPGIPGFTIPDSVSVFSSVIPIAAAEFFTPFGTVLLPNAGKGQQPIVNGTIVMGNDTEVAGFKVVNRSGVGIQGANLKEVYIYNNTVENSAKEGILLRNVTGPVDVTDNVINQTGPNASGIDFRNTTGDTQSLITNNMITNTGGGGIFVNLDGTAQGKFTIDRNSLSRNGFTGISTRAQGNSVLKTFITNNTVDNTQPAPSESPSGVESAPYGVTRGINAFVEGTARHTTVIDNNQLTSAGIFTVAQKQSFLDATITNNTITSKTSTVDNSGILYAGYENSDGQLTIQGNTVSGFYSSEDVTLAGIRVALYNAATATANLTKNTVTKNERGIDVSASNTAKLNVTIDGNTVTGNRLDGVLVTGASSLTSIGTGTPTIAADIRNNTLNSNSPNPLAGGFGDLTLATFSPGAKVCFNAANNWIGVLAIADQTIVSPNPLLNALLSTPPLAFLSGQISSELPYEPSANANGNGNTVIIVNPLSAPLWSQAKVDPGKCVTP